MQSMLVPKCANCKRIDCSMLTCARCSLVAYCSKECQKHHWKNGHKGSCKKKTGEVRLVSDEQTAGEAAALTSAFLQGNCMNADLPTDIFHRMSLEERATSAAAFSVTTKKMRKKRANSGAETAHQVWKRAVAYTGVVGIEICNHAPFAAKKALLEFFRLHEVFQGMASTQEQRDIWNVHSYVKAMVYNSYQVDQQIMNAENEEWRARLEPMPPSVQRSEQVYLLVENIELEQATFGPLGQIFVDANVAFIVDSCVRAVHMLLQIGCPPAYGLDSIRSSKLMEKQLSVAYDILASTPATYHGRSEHIAALDRLRFFVVIRKLTPYAQTSA